jgi:TPR repeat protein
VPQDLTAAAEWFGAPPSKASPAQFRLGGLNEKGLGVPKNPENARRLYLAAAEAGNAKAMHNLAVLTPRALTASPITRPPPSGSARPPITACPTASTISAFSMPAASAWK